MNVLRNAKIMKALTLMEMGYLINNVLGSLLMKVLLVASYMAHVTLSRIVVPLAKVEMSIVVHLLQLVGKVPFF